MKKIFLCLLLSISVSAFGQKLVIGSKAPVIKDVKWLSGTYDAKQATVILFYQKNNESCVAQYNVLKGIVEQGKANGVVITRDGDIDADLLSYQGKIVVAYDAEGIIFGAYGVKYLPFAIAVGGDGKVLWIGALREKTN